MNRLRSRLIAVFVLATAVPLGLTLWTTLQLVDSSLELAPLDELQSVTDTLEETGREVYQQARESLHQDVVEGRIQGKPAAPDALEPNSDEAFVLGGPQGDELHYYVRRGGSVVDYSRSLGVPLKQLTEQISEARRALDLPVARDVRGGFSRVLILVAAGLWFAALAALIYFADRISRPIRRLTQGLGRVASGDLSARVESSGEGEIGEAMVAFNHMAGQMEQAREHLKQAHESGQCADL
jgi:nitrogen fixation/metabolism regulation signal transduction histidine kinase